ncbi:ABC transporter ATP-binding protein [Treponema bryantii]|uniref:ABC transporter ATP-binding protein n=1 Tax=Treponema bryantii TaxID=163 RepID=UPI0003B4B613|nr:energy-coupling factor ABC transporter ATP-binding protein [Treponema bryantii]
MVELKNVTFEYNSGEGLERGSAGGIGEKISNGSLRGVNLSVTEGEFILLTGGSGCGKTTILRLINGLIPNFFEGNLEGSVTVDSFDVSHAELYDTAKSVSTVFQNPRSQFFNVDTTSELAFACENQGMEESEILQRIDKTVSELHLEPLMNRSLFDLSGGQKQKIACASVAVTGNKIILLDEPSANLDLRTIDELAGLLKKWKSEGKTIIVAEHRISYLWDLADRTVVLKDGQIVQELSRAQMDKISEEELHALGLRSARHTQTKKRFSIQNDNNSLTLKNFKYKYRNGYLALNIPYLEIPRGKITAITGNNGDGKTTLLNCLCGLGHRSKGTLIYNGKTYKASQRQKLIYFVMQDVNHQLFTESVLDEVLISQPEENEEEARRILASLDLEQFTDRHPQSLSGGQKQRVAVASAIASGRDIMLFDEPTSGLDYTHMLQIGQILRSLKDQGKTVIVVTHDRELIKECCDCEICLRDFNQINPVNQA